MELQKLAAGNQRISLHRLDITIPEDIKALVWELGDESLDVLINNAGIYLEKNEVKLGGIRYDDWLRTFEVNTLGGVRVSEALLDNVGRSEKRLIVALSSHMGSIADIGTPGSYYYRSSKAALNAAMEAISAALRARDIGVLVLHPGGVATRMGPSGGITTAESVQGMRRIIDNFSMEQSGVFLQYDNTMMPW